ncbi:putative receptor protein-tyrosine kinase RLK-Pelle-C-LEC family [Helianthus annuus]|uniref:Receptor protein-tyrosine kinase RLK-Pelle-C-LEC family n=2 Tax=Helianthus annuus TaxID=4232 RepID=A0A9K3HXT6_HELAN|nr:C-type lectin receptor-like tyrosine-protein kinase At1g52310 [Helianthus annuus]XP_021988886.1 C-type lectin receptor-like tyrosine-protein kinase At1g52310 [Helianthus annuus]KAF5786523.1 putative receptor protein-tyrosine kinase RLK-Pelle-C-LEC family [Helianthus annuus]KAJ0521911.1 putative receptor protein-tyrosine kinase RLK-Pelle-C-LEC family [Helianthus annuus]KAJ0530046.1 putative receptor protein-tyrosine kinase RLK-Pelle-C-LEC family [Helianthus annuus]KAJ0696904.1 putative recep
MEGMMIHSAGILLLVACFMLGFEVSEAVSNDSILAASSRNESHYKAPCPSGWVTGPSNKICFKSIGNTQSWNESETSCRSNNAHLAALTSLAELNFLQDLCSKSTANNECWVGGIGTNTNTSNSIDWKWSDDTYNWNTTLLTVTTRDLKSTCTNSSCFYSYNESASLCTVLTNRMSLVAEKCNISHTSICMRLAENRCQHMHCHKEYLIILATVSGLILFTTFAVVIWLLVYKRSKRRRKSRKLSNLAETALVPPSWKIFTREELRSITKNFSEGNRLIGDAKTGGTYSGTLPDGSRVAVKRLKRSTFQRKKEFYSEIGRVARLCHPNLVPVKGCCYDHGDRYIVYEFVVNGPLDRWLHHIPLGGRTLDWTMRMKVATTLAQGIAFLHDKVKPQVVHRDIRASNVLLDEDFNAHLMGVGLSKFVPWEVMHGRTVMAGGTHGYLAPEFVYRNELTTKSDVYSFGVLLLEIISGRRPASQAVDSVGWQSIFEWATPLVQSHRYLELLDPVISASSSTSPSRIPEAGVVQKVVDLVYSCTQHVPSMRPRMSHVVHQLQQLAA